MESVSESTREKKVAIVTGAARGLGLLTARKLATRGYRVVLTARDVKAGQAAVAEIRTAVKGAQLECLELDTSSLQSVRAFVEAFQALGLPLHLLVNNAGIMSMKQQPEFSVDGFEITMATNAVGPFLLTHLLLPDLRRAAPSRIVIVASSMHIAGVGKGPGPDFDWNNLNAEKSFHPVVAYRNSKLALMWFTYELSRRLEGTGVSVNAVCPGFVPATLVRHQPNAFARFLFRFVLPLMSSSRSPEQGTDNTIYAATSPELEGVSGKFLMDCAERRSSDDSYDRAKAERWWSTASSLCGIDSSNTETD
jgi:retinol dehydrogenase-12